jgi:hypothetical protein
MTKHAFLFLFLFLLSLNAHGEDHSFKKDNMIRSWSGRKDRAQENFDWEVKDIRSKLEDASGLADEELKKLLERVQKLRAVQQVFKERAEKLQQDGEVSPGNKDRLSELITLYDERLATTQKLSLEVLQKQLQAVQRKTQLQLMEASQGEFSLSY